MPRTRKIVLLATLLCLLAGGWVFAQNQYGGGYGGGGGFGGGGRRRGGFGGGGFGRGGFGGPGGPTYGPMVPLEGGGYVNQDTVKTARETAGHSVDLPAWTNPPGFKYDTFTFARIIFNSIPAQGWLGWANDYPDADLNLSYRLKQFTSMKVDPDGRVLKLTDPDLYDYPFIWMSHPQAMNLGAGEVRNLRQYLMNGGSLMVDDFWGDYAWDHFEGEMNKVLPGRKWVELTIDHPIFHGVFDLKGPMSRLQVPTIHLWERTTSYYNVNSEQNSAQTDSGPADPVNGYRGETMHVRAWLDDKNRVMVVAIHNSDTGDGMEREGEDEDYFHIFSERRAYPLTIDIIYYFMTH